MTGVHELSRTDARRIAVRAQLLAKDRPTDLLDVVRRLWLVQLEPTAAVAPSAELVLWSRLGSSFDARELWDALDEQRLVELRGALKVPEDVALFRAEMDEWPGAGPLRDWEKGLAAWVRTNNACRLDLLDRLRADGPLPSSELPDSCVEPWPSSGWNNNRNLRMMLSMLEQRGEVAAAGGTGRDRLWDLAERIYPDDPYPPTEEGIRLRNERRLSSLGLARAKAPGHPFEPMHVGDAGEPAVVDGVKGTWRVDPAQLEGLGARFQGRAALLSPLDRLLHDRRRMDDVFEFDYILEMYKPVEQRVWGYWAMPILYGDRLVGKLDARSDRKAGIFEVTAVHEDAPFGRAMAVAVDREIKDLARWLDLELVRGR
ncbi:MAG: crosslink repair DNA glycosylase YcaQ family protein [Nocardioidaceae bacterium]